MWLENGSQFHKLESWNEKAGGVCLGLERRTDPNPLCLPIPLKVLALIKRGLFALFITTWFLPISLYRHSPTIPFLSSFPKHYLILALHLPTPVFRYLYCSLQILHAQTGIRLIKLLASPPDHPWSPSWAPLPKACWVFPLESPAITSTPCPR